jgi:DNA (cytosine-5)-methyltransferase 1
VVVKGVYYNEYDEYLAEWLRQLIKAGVLPEGDVDTRSILDVEASDLSGYRQCHFFAGIGGWPYALKLAEWPDDRFVWSGSCPCPPFSSVPTTKKLCPRCNKENPIPDIRRVGFFTCIWCYHSWYEDERHLWPAFWPLIEKCRPTEVFGEQVAGRDGRIWLAGVRSTLEAIGYGVGAASMPSASVGAACLRYRLYWVAASTHATSMGYSSSCRFCTDKNARRSFTKKTQQALSESVAIRTINKEYRRISTKPGDEPLAYGLPRGMGYVCPKPKKLPKIPKSTIKKAWKNYEGRLRGYGNAINPELAATFIRAYMKT